MIDSHCHLTDEAFMGQQDAVIARAKAQGVEACLSVACSLKEAEKLESLLDNPFVYGACGIHPEYALSGEKLGDLERFYAHPKMLGVGETGLDAHYGAETLKEQEALFCQHIELAIDLQKPLIIHAREADAKIEEIMTRYLKKKTFKAVLHCFSSGERLADWALECGIYLSASGMITFKNAEKIRSIFKRVPMDKLLIETDAPYLAPVPFRGKTNEPAFVAKTAEVLAELKGISVAELDAITTTNFKALFSSQS